MEKYSIDYIRNKFLSFFEQNDHLIEHSYSLIPKDDASLLIIGAGMAPLKKYFTGVETPPKKRMATCQKCVRTGDIENVGVTARHATFFEMLGNFSFGDYFKEKAITFGWDFMTEVLEINEEKLWVTVYEEDDEAFEIWNKKIGLNKDRIVRLGKKDNFWELEVGPSGPCSEIHYDRGEKYGCSNPDCKPGCDCDRYIEVWNLVFTQFDKDANGNYNPLSNPNIDTGMGLERIAVVLQEKESIFDIEPMISIINKIEDLSDVKYRVNKKNDTSIRIICDHARAVTFMICDGIMPSNEGRGYVLRRLIRRALRHGKLLGINENFLNTLSKIVISKWKDAYPELVERESFIEKIINIEEDKFKKTIDQGLEILHREIQKLQNENKNILEGNIGFKLYDTYGFPYELTEEILKEKNINFGKDEFFEKMEEQRQRARGARGKTGAATWEGSCIKLDEEETIFTGYDELSSEAQIKSIYVSGNKVNEISTGEKGIIVLNRTPFYAELGGQKGDTGELINVDSKAEVIDTIKGNNNTFIHKVSIKAGTFKENDNIVAKVDNLKRKDIEKNHTTTHILHQVLRNNLGEHVKQAGSFVSDERLRFDYEHFESVNEKVLSKIEKEVNEIIFKDLCVHTNVMSLNEAKKTGATAQFEEKYGNTVRVVEIEDFSKELCGGTHIDSTLKIGSFKIISESSISSGIRRIEAVTGRKAYEYYEDSNRILENLMLSVKASKKDVINKIENIKNDLKEKEKEVLKYKRDKLNNELDDILSAYKIIDDSKVFLHKFNNIDANALRDIVDKIKDKNDSFIILLASSNNNKVIFVSSVSKDMIKKGIHAGNIVKEAAKITGGGGGGRPDFAQAGGKNTSKIDEALNNTTSVIKDKLL